MDPEVTRLCCEFLLQKLGRESETLIKKLECQIPLLTSDFRLKRMVVLRTLQDDLSKLSISETMLVRLEVLEEIHHELGASVTAAMRDAYCAIAVECTLKYLDLEASPDNTEYIDAVERIWRSRIIHMEPSPSGGGGGGGGCLLFSPDLKRWSFEIEASLVNPQVMKRFSNLNTRRNAIQKLKAFLAETWEDLGPSFLELVASCPPTSDKGLPGVEQEPRTCITSHQQRVTPQEEIQEGSQLPEANCIGTSTHKTLLDGHVLGLSASQDRVTVEIRPGDQCTTMSPEEVDPSDPLPALHVPGILRSELPMKDMNRESPAQKQTTDLPDSPVCRNIRNNNEQQDSIENLHEGASKGASRFHLPSPKRKKTSPLKKYEPDNLIKRRRLKKWSALEEETLRAAVNKMGDGYWKNILNAHMDIFVGRTQVDLKDKWRNLKRYGK